ncbi:hypothetical protein C0Q70_11225 [Pomacea canaliculata]|uniref:Uncharacterized protein n=1 Tax=Pomacea canaliculata TaxID=400727 RepID=A0A2T7P5E3_POMCA|nr:hypothetical protein C0Q70_11225 [Pomacea canaliculata]
MEPSLVWNRLLVTELLPLALAGYDESGLPMATPRTNSVPDLVQGHSLPHVSASDAWIPLSKAVLQKFSSSTDPDVVQAVINIYIINRESLVQLPSHVMSGLEQLRLLNSAQTITPHHVSELILTCHQQLGDTEKLLLLQYLCSHGNEVQLLLDRCLLPLQNGSFGVFRRRGGGDEVFWCEDQMQELFPGLENMMCRSSVSVTVKDHLKRWQSHVGHFSLRVLDKTSGDVARLMESVQKRHGHSSLTPRSQESWMRHRFSLPSYVSDHKQILGGLVQYPTTRGILAALEKVSGDPVRGEKADRDFNTSSTEAERESIRKFIANAEQLDPQRVSILTDLQLFTDMKRKQLVSVRQVNTIGPRDLPPVPPPWSLLRCDGSARFAALKLGASEVSLNTIAEKILKSIQENGYSSSDTKNFMVYFLNNYELMANKSLTDLARNIQFVPSSSGHLYKPRDLYDAQNGVLRELFLREDMFPCDEFSQPKDRQKPSDYPKTLPLRSYPAIVCPCEMALYTDLMYCGSTRAVTRPGMPEGVAKRLTVVRELPPQDVISHLQTAISHYNIKESHQYKLIFHRVFEWLNSCKSTKDVSQFLKETDCVLVESEGRFCRPKQFWVNKRYGDIDLRPYRFLLPSDMSSVSDLFLRCGSCQYQDDQLLQEVLSEVKKNHETGTVSKSGYTRDMRLVKVILYVLKENEEIVFVHTEIDADTAVRLGAVKMKDRALTGIENLDFGYGQHEELTDRLHNLLKDSYTDGFSVPKELIQNADDAGATE